MERGGSVQGQKRGTGLASRAFLRLILPLANKSSRTFQIFQMASWFPGKLWPKQTRATGSYNPSAAVVNDIIHTAMVVHKTSFISKMQHTREQTVRQGPATLTFREKERLP